MSGNLYRRRMGEEYDTIFRQCVSLNTELHKLVPLAKQMHLLSSNAVSSAARAGSEGDAFRVLTQDIQLLGVDVSECINDSQDVIADIVKLSSKLAGLFSTYLTFDDIQSRIDDVKTKTQPEFFEHSQSEVSKEIINNNDQLARKLNMLTNLLSPLSLLVKKGEYLAVCSSVEAASAGEHGVSFEAVSSMLKTLVSQLAKQSARQRSLLRDLSDSMEKQQYKQKDLLNAFRTTV